MWRNRRTNLASFGSATSSNFQSSTYINYLDQGLAGPQVELFARLAEPPALFRFAPGFSSGAGLR